MKFRHEYKFYVNQSEYIVLRQRLRSVMESDSHADENGEYKIRSLYFDNLYDKALLEKLNGVNNREKFRIRYYNDDFSKISLEKKSKINGLCNKVSAPLTKEECEKILDGDLDWMLESPYDLVKELYVKMKTQLLKPKVLVDYMREPFVYEYGNVRITLDRDIRTGLYVTDLFDLDAPTIIAGEPVIILEVKYDEYLPGFIRDIVDLKNKQATAYSKYGVCRILG